MKAPIKEVALLHGIWSTGRRDVKKFVPYLEDTGFKMHPFDYPFTFLLRTWFYPKRDRLLAQELSDQLKGSQPHLIAHSNGCRLAVLAMERGARFDHVFFFGPAWPSDYTFPKSSFNRLFVIHSKLDTTVLGGSFLPFHQFGMMGVVGYRGPNDERIINVNATPTTHMGYFNRSLFPYWTRFVLKQLSPVS